MICVYGKPKRKKTSDVLAAFPNALFIGVPSAISLVAQNELGFTPAVYESPPQTLPELVHLLQSIADQKIAENYGAIVIDDASHICKRSMLVWQQEAPKGRSGKRDRFFPYQQLNEYLLRLSSAVIKQRFFLLGATSTYVLWSTLPTQTHGSPTFTTATPPIPSGLRETEPVCAIT